MRPRSLRASFVVTVGVTLASPLAADPPRRCPRLVPVEGSRCQSAGQRCGYSRCGGTGPFGTVAVCDPRTQRWRLRRGPTCNPPATPQPPLDALPRFEPQ